MSCNFFLLCFDHATLNLFIVFTACYFVPAHLITVPAPTTVLLPNRALRT